MPNDGDHLEWDVVNNGFKMVPSPNATNLAGDGLTAMTSPGQLDCDYSVIATNLAGEGLLPFGPQITFDATAAAGSGLMGAGSILDVDMTSLATSLQGAYLTASGSVLDVDRTTLATDLAGTGLTATPAGQLEVTVTKITREVRQEFSKRAHSLDTIKLSNSKLSVQEVAKKVNELIRALHRAGILSKE